MARDAHALARCRRAGDHRARARRRERVGLRERESIAHRPPVAVLLQFAAHTAHHHADALEAVGRAEQGLEVRSTRGCDFAEVAEAFMQALVGVPPGLDGGRGTPARERRCIAPVGDGDQVVVPVGVHAMGQIVVTGAVGQGEVASDLQERGAGPALHRRAARLHAEVARHDLGRRHGRARRPTGVGWRVIVCHAALAGARAAQVLGDGRFHGAAPWSAQATTGSGTLPSGSGVSCTTTGVRRVLFSSSCVTSGRE
ncbi:hypothetical protein D3C72_1297590 [compost metagenome]